MYKTCLGNGVGPDDQMYSDQSWGECSEKCNREQLMSAHESTEKPVFHTQYLSDKQYENFKLINQIQSKIKKPKKVNKKVN